MSEEATDNASEATQVAETPVSMVNPDGTFVDGWTETLDEDSKADQSLKTVPNVAGLAKMFVHVQKQVGKDKMVKPTDTSTEEEWNTVYDTLGRPSTPGDYGFKRPDDIPEENYNVDFANAAQELMYKEGFSQKQAQAIFDFQNNYVAAALKQQEMDVEQARADVDAQMNELWGNAKPQKLHLAQVALDTAVGDDEGFRERMSQKHGDDFDFIVYSAALGAKFSESSAITSTQVPTPMDYQTQIDGLMQTPAYMGGPDIPDNVHQTAVQKVNRLISQKVKSAG